ACARRPIISSTTLPAAASAPVATPMASKRVSWSRRQPTRPALAPPSLRPWHRITPLMPHPETAVSQEHTLKAIGLAKRYKGRQVVHDTTLEVRSGEIVGLLGPNGAGKTTSFYMIIGLVKADAGQVLLDGDD